MTKFAIMKFTIAKQPSIAASTVTHSSRGFISTGRQYTRFLVYSISCCFPILSMAPSRALLLRRISSAATTPHLRPTSRLLATSAAPVQRTRRISALWSSPVQQPQVCRSCTRAYSQSASTTPQPPDYLNEAELHVFNKIRSELEPMKLEVCSAFPTFLSPYMASMRR